MVTEAGAASGAELNAIHTGAKHRQGVPDFNISAAFSVCDLFVSYSMFCDAVELI